MSYTYEEKTGIIPSGLVHRQQESPLFSKLPAELRLAVYECVFWEDGPAILVPPSSWFYPTNHCSNQSNSVFLPHKSAYYGIEKVVDGRVKRLAPYREEYLFALLNTCRRMYLEAKDTVYPRHHYNIEAHRAFHNMNTSIGCQQLYCIYVSMIFELEWFEHMERSPLFSAQRQVWIAACKALTRLQNAHHFQRLPPVRIRLVFWKVSERWRTNMEHFNPAPSIKIILGHFPELTKSNDVKIILNYPLRDKARSKVMRKRTDFEISFMQPKYEVGPFTDPEYVSVEWPSS